MFTPPNLLTQGGRKDYLREVCSQTCLGTDRVAGRFLASSPFGALVQIYFISVVLWRKEVSGSVEPLADKLWELMLIL